MLKYLILKNIKKLKEFHLFINPIVNKMHSLWETQEPETKLSVCI